MSDRVQQVLDGELPPHQLDPQERDELAAYEEVLDTTLAGLRAEPAPDLSASVMLRVRDLPAFAPEMEPASAPDPLRTVRDHGRVCGAPGP